MMRKKCIYKKGRTCFWDFSNHICPCHHVVCLGRHDPDGGGKVPENVLQEPIGLKLQAKTLAQLKNPKKRYLVEKIEKMTQQIGRNKKETVMLHNLEDLCTTKRNRKRELVDKKGKQSK